jgi:hypothetical protein
VAISRKTLIRIAESQYMQPDAAKQAGLFATKSILVPLPVLLAGAASTPHPISHLRHSLWDEKIPL